jgi:hypothetical protein
VLSSHDRNVAEDSVATLDIYLRAYTEAPKSESKRRRYPHPAPGWIPGPGEREVIVFDTERTMDSQQRLTFGVWRLCRVIEDRSGNMVRLACREEGILYADDLPERDPDGMRALERYAREHRPAIDDQRHALDLNACTSLLLWPRTRFVEERIFKGAYKRKMPLVGFNLPFDISGLAITWQRARGHQYGGGFAFVLWTYQDKRGCERPHPYRPTLNVKPIDGHRALMGFGGRRNPDPEDADTNGRRFSGYFVDLYTLVSTLTGEKQSLASACVAFETKTRKRRAKHGTITPKYIDYARNDVAATTELYECARRELQRHPIDLPAHEAFSPASLGKGYMRAMRVQPRLEIQPAFPREILGAAASAYYGGRVEAPILGSVPVRYLDVMSMYSTVNVLMHLWGLVTAQRIEVQSATGEVRELLEDITLDDALRLEAWPAFVGMAKLADPDPSEPRPVLPLRCNYRGGSAPTIAVNELVDLHEGWYAIPDLIASKLITGAAPRIERAVRFIPVGRQPLQSVALRGDIPIDPTRRDFFAALIEERQRLKRKPDKTPEEEWRAQALKITASSTSYGIGMEMLRDESSPNKLKASEVHGPSDSFTATVNFPEVPRHYCFPPLAGVITAGARLVLAMLEVMVRQAAGCWAFGDTDSLAIVSTREGGLVLCPGGVEQLPDGSEAVRALSRAEVDDIIARFARLNPYDPESAGGSIVELREKDDSARSGEGEQLYAFVLGTKRYALYALDECGQVIVRKFSEHGLGLRLDPIDPLGPVAADERGVADEDPADDATPRLVGAADPARGGRRWIEEWWRYLIERHALEREVPEPPWLDRPALAKLTITDPDIAQRLQLPPFNSMLVAHPAPFGHAVGVDPEHFRLLGPFESDPRRWTRMRWVDLYSGRAFRITTEPITGIHEAGVVHVKSYRDVMDEFLAHPESKLAIPDGRPCTRRYRGVLRRRVVVPGDEHLIGKEGNHPEATEAGLRGIDDVLTKFHRCDPRDAFFDRYVRPALRTFPRSTITAGVGISARTVERVRAGATPTPNHRRLLYAWAFEQSGKELRTHGLTANNNPRRRFESYLRLGGDLRVCQGPGCTKKLQGRQRRFHSHACRMAAARHRDRPTRGSNTHQN